MKPTTYTITDFRQGIKSNVYEDGLARIEHFDVTVGQARQQAKLILSTSVAYTADIEDNALTAMTLGNDLVYALGLSPGLGFAVFKWNAGSNNYWEGVTEQSGSPAQVLKYYKGALYGIRSGGAIWKVTTGGAYTATVDTLAAYTTYADPVIHSKDGLMYFFIDNTVWSFDGTTAPASASLTLPTNFVITAACESGDYILIVGYDSSSGVSTGYLWDRDSSLSTLTAKYDLGTDRVKLVANLGGTNFFVSHKQNSTNSPNTDKPAMIIRYVNGDKAQILNIHEFDALSIPFGAYITNEKLYFNAYVKMYGDTDSKNVVVSINQRGEMVFELNVGANGTTPATVMGLVKEGDGWWIGGNTNGSWNSVNAYGTVASFETSVISSDDFSHNLKFRGATITCHPIPKTGVAVSSIILKARVDDETTWTTLQTFSTENGVKFSTNLAICMNAHNGLARAKRAQFRVECDGTDVQSPVTITGFQAVFDPIPDEKYG